MNRSNTSRLVLATAFACLLASNAFSITFSDQDFLSQDWTPIIHVRDDPTVSGTTSLNSVGSMTRANDGGVGNSAYFRSLIGLDLGDIINTSGIYIDETYAPREQAIASLDYSMLVNHFNSDPSTSTSLLPALLQDGRLFVGQSTLFNGNTWKPISGGNLANLTANDFVAVDFWFTQEIIRPDFSAFGESIQFGYSLQNNVAFGPGFVATRGVDNWSVTVNSAALSDVEGDGVEASDLAFWKTGYGTPEDAFLGDGDFDRDGDVDGADFLKWQVQFGDTSGLLAISVPEPSTPLLIIAFGLVTLVIPSSRQGDYSLWG